MRRGRLLAGIAAALLIAAPAAWYFGSPWWTLWRMREAARSGDMTALARYVDFRALAVQAAAGDRTAWSSVFKSIRLDSSDQRRLIAIAKRQLAGQNYEASVKEVTVPFLSKIPIHFLGSGGGDLGYRPSIVRHRLDHFEVLDRGDSPRSAPVLGFRREGLSWKLDSVHWWQE
ncbi:MAG TPA: DUF2939 domain-containing protein [Allosphingosinicella sp.]